MYKDNEVTGLPVLSGVNQESQTDPGWVYLSSDSVTDTTEYVPYFKITPTTLVKYWKPLHQFRDANGLKPGAGKPAKEGKEPKPPESSKTTGELSKESSKRLKKIINAWSMYQKIMFYKGRSDWEKLNLLTLTLPAKQIEGDRSLKNGPFRAFRQWLTSMGVWYLWKAEPQANGNLHFHLAIGQYLPIRRVTRKWNKLIPGYVARYKAKWILRDQNGFKYDPESRMSYEKQLKAYNSRQLNGYDQPNTCDIETGQNKKDLEGYLAKYVAKSENRRPVDGRLWGRSDELAHVKGYDTYESYEVYSLEKRLNQGGAKWKCHDEYYSAYYGNVLGLIKKHYPGILENLYEHCLQIEENIKHATINPP